jgi:hypothetical protein
MLPLLFVPRPHHLPTANIAFALSKPTQLLEAKQANAAGAELVD